MTYTLPENASSMVDLFQKTNAMVGGDILAIMFMFMVFFITLIASSARLSFEKSLAFAAWFTMLSSFFITIIFNTSAGLMIIPIIMVVASVFLLKKETE